MATGLRGDPVSGGQAEPRRASGAGDQALGVLASDRAEVVEGLRRRLVSAANASGGWAYQAAKASRLEPTIWALLALLSDGNSSATLTERLSRDRGFLLGARDADGLLAEQPVTPPNFVANGLAALLFQQYPAVFERRRTRQLLATLVTRSGEHLPTSDFLAQDNSLQGWAWIDGTSSWVEPTAWCLLALKRASASVPPLVSGEVVTRIVEAEALLVDRCSPAGGWNYGNPIVFGQVLQSYIPTTAVALLALQDRPDHPAVRRSLRFLQANRFAEPSGFALALTLMCLRIYGLAGDDIERLLVDAARGGTSVFLNLHGAALALYALTGADHGYEAVRI